MKRLAAVLLAAVMLTGCAGAPVSSAQTEESASAEVSAASRTEEIISETDEETYGEAQESAETGRLFPKRSTPFIPPCLWIIGS